MAVNRMTRWTCLALGSVFILAAAGCFNPIGPARTYDDYEHKAKDTAESALSSVQTARLVARVATRGDAFGPYVSVMLSESETGAAHASSVFASVQPPDDHADRLRARLSPMLNRAEEHLARLRIAARRGELDRLHRLARPLRPLSRRLERFISRHE
jgi:hypothetical protein